MTRGLRDITQESMGSLERVAHGNKSGLLGAAAPPGYDGRLTYYLLSNKAHDIECLPDWLVGNIVNLRPINDTKELNVFFNAINAKLPRDGIFVGCLETQKQVKARIFKKLPWVLAHIVFCLVFFYKRIFPQVVFMRNVYYFFSKGRNQMLSKAEVFGRLVYSGFEIVEYRQIDQLSYFFAMKKEPFSTQRVPSTGPVLKVRRVGKGARMADIYLFRTRQPYAEFSNESLYICLGGKPGKWRGDLESNSWGHLLRKCCIDKIPMLYNVFKGDLKIIGVGLLGAQDLGLYPADVIERRLRYKPGLISPWYVDKPKTLDEMIASEERYLEAYERQPMITDIQYLLRAMKTIVFRAFGHSASPYANSQEAGCNA